MIGRNCVERRFAASWTPDSCDWVRIVRREYECGVGTVEKCKSAAWLHREVVRRFSDECPAATFVTNPQTPHSLTIHTDYQKVHSMMGTFVLYQLVLLDSGNNPLMVTKKDWLRREVKPICKVIQQQLRTQ